MTKLTDEQRVFAEENHGLILSFLGRKRLNHDEWYDILALKYLYAVSTYQPDKSAFSSYAFYHMEQGIGAEFLARSRKNRVLNYNMTSLNDLVGDEKETERIDLLSKDDYLQDEVNFKVSFNSFLEKLSANKRKVLILVSMGYNFSEIGAMLSLSRERIRQIISACKIEYYQSSSNIPINESVKKDSPTLTSKEIKDFISQNRISIRQIEKQLGLGYGTLHYRINHLNSKWEDEITKLIGYKKAS